MSDDFPDVEGGLRTYLRADAGVIAATATVGSEASVWFGIPKGATEAYYPMAVVFLVTATDDTSDAPLDIPLVQIDCWGSLHPNGNGDKASATALVNAVRSALHAVRGRTVLAPGITAFGFNVESAAWLPDPDNDRPRYAITAEGAAISS